MFIFYMENKINLLIFLKKLNNIQKYMTYCYLILQKEEI